MSFGVTNAPAIFMDDSNFLALFGPICGDILIYSRTPQEPGKQLRIILSVLREKQLFAKLSVDFGWPKLSFLVMSYHK